MQRIFISDNQFAGKYVRCVRVDSCPLNIIVFTVIGICTGFNCICAPGSKCSDQPQSCLTVRIVPVQVQLKEFRNRGLGLRILNRNRSISMRRAAYRNIIFLCRICHIAYSAIRIHPDRKGNGLHIIAILYC